MILNSKTHFGSVTKFFHWLTALLILTAIPLGLLANNGDLSTEEGITRTVWLFSLHKTVGIAAFFTALGRILWAVTQEHPALLNQDKPGEAFLALTIHWLLYFSMLLVPMSGWLHHAATEGFSPILWPLGQDLPLVPKSEDVAHFFEVWHFIFTKILALSVFLHIAGAIKHHFVDKDATLRRMLPGTPALPQLFHKGLALGPLGAAILVYSIAITAGTVFGIPAEQKPTPSAVEQNASGNWVVQDGVLSIKVKQFGSEVTGSFERWTSTISFNPDTQTGQVDTVIDVSTLTLGSVTSQALGEDYFNAETFPSAVFSGEIGPADTGLIADGSLTLRGVTMPLTLPFELVIEGNQATVTASTRVDRRDFNIGQSQPTETNLAFAVAINIELTATKTE